jgi:hypothetical protein
MKITADGSSEPSINFTLEEDFGDVNIMANRKLIAYFHVSPDSEVYLQLVTGIDGDVEGLSVTPPICGRLEVKQ